MWRRLRSLIRKELLVLLRDPRARFVLIGPPLLQMFLFSYAATLEVTNIDIAVLNRDAGRWSVELLQRIAGSPFFRSVTLLEKREDIRDIIDNRKAIAVLTFAPDFSRKVETRQPAEVQVILDGRRSNASQIVGGYLNTIAGGLSQSILFDLENQPMTASEASGATVIRNWFNPNLTYIWFTVPSLLGTLALLIALIVTGQSVARERELGTFDQLMVSPLRTEEILLGKVIPPVIVGMAQTTAFLLVATLFFHVPFRGSLFLLYLAVFCFIAAVVGIGLFVSSLAQTQQQAFLGTFMFASPAILLSGFATPIENMPHWLQTFTLINPLRHFLVIIRGVFLKGMPANEVLANIGPLILIAAFTLTVSALLFRSRTE